MLDLTPGPYRNDYEAQELRHKKTLEELSETQDGLATERAENRLLRSENLRLRGRFTVSRLGLLVLGCLRYGMKPYMAFVCGLLFMGIMSSGNVRERAPARLNGHRPRPQIEGVERRPSMLVPSFFYPTTNPYFLRCYSQTMCYEACYTTPSRLEPMIWTSGGEMPDQLHAELPYLVEVELVITYHY